MYGGNSASYVQDEEAVGLLFYGLNATGCFCGAWMTTFRLRFQEGEGKIAFLTESRSTGRETMYILIIATMSG
jgi:hypothetical protein